MFDFITFYCLEQVCFDWMVATTGSVLKKVSFAVCQAVMKVLSVDGIAVRSVALKKVLHIAAFRVVKQVLFVEWIAV